MQVTASGSERTLQAEDERCMKQALATIVPSCRPQHSVDGLAEAVVEGLLLVAEPALSARNLNADALP
jgi:hypothetical protein